MQIKGRVKQPGRAVTQSLSKGVRWLALTLRQAQYDLRTHYYLTLDSRY